MDNTKRNDILKSRLKQSQLSSIVNLKAINSRFDRPLSTVERRQLLQSQKAGKATDVDKTLLKKQKKKARKRRTKNLRGELAQHLREQRRFTQGEFRDKPENEPRIFGDTPPGPPVEDPQITRDRLALQERQRVDKLAIDNLRLAIEARKVTAQNAQQLALIQRLDAAGMGQPQIQNLLDRQEGQFQAERQGRIEERDELRRVIDIGGARADQDRAQSTAERREIFDKDRVDRGLAVRRLDELIREDREVRVGESEAARAERVQINLQRTAERREEAEEREFLRADTGLNRLELRKERDLRESLAQADREELTRLRNLPDPIPELSQADTNAFQRGLFSDNLDNIGGAIERRLGEHEDRIQEQLDEHFGRTRPGQSIPNIIFAPDRPLEEDPVPERPPISRDAASAIRAVLQPIPSVLEPSSFDSSEFREDETSRRGQGGQQVVDSDIDSVSSVKSTVLSSYGIDSDIDSDSDDEHLSVSSSVFLRDTPPLANVDILSDTSSSRPELQFDLDEAYVAVEERDELADRLEPSEEPDPTLADRATNAFQIGAGKASRGLQSGIDYLGEVIGPSGARRPTVGEQTGGTIFGLEEKQKEVDSSVEIRPGGVDSSVEIRPGGVDSSVEIRPGGVDSSVEVIPLGEAKPRVPGLEPVDEDFDLFGSSIARGARGGGVNLFDTDVSLDAGARQEPVRRPFLQDSPDPSPPPSPKKKQNRESQLERQLAIERVTSARDARAVFEISTGKGREGKFQGPPPEKDIQFELEKMRNEDPSGRSSPVTQAINIGFGPLSDSSSDVGEFSPIEEKSWLTRVDAPKKALQPDEKSWLTRVDAPKKALQPPGGFVPGRTFSPGRGSRRLSPPPGLPPVRVSRTPNFPPPPAPTVKEVKAKGLVEEVVEEGDEGEPEFEQDFEELLEEEPHPPPKGAQSDPVVRGSNRLWDNDSVIFDLMEKTQRGKRSKSANQAEVGIGYSLTNKTGGYLKGIPPYATKKINGMESEKLRIIDPKKRNPVRTNIKEITKLVQNGSLIFTKD